MVNSVSAQTLEFLYSALLGIGLGVTFDIMKVIRYYIPKSRAMTAVFDTLFWCVAVVALLGFILTVSDGVMRWYVLVGAFCGGFVYIAAVSEIVFKMLMSLVCVLRKVFSMITRPLYLFLRWVWRCFKRTGRRAEKSMRDNIRKKRMKKRKAGKNGGKKAKKAQGPVS